MKTGLQQGENITVWVLFEGPLILEAFTHRVQAEAAERRYKKAAPNGKFYLTSVETEPHDNHC